MGVRLKDRSLLVDGALFALCAASMNLLLVRAFAESYRPEERQMEKIGQLERRTNQVRRRADGTLVWHGLDTGESIFGRDAVYAGEDSEAVIRLDDGSRIEVDQNSLVLVQHITDSEASDLPLLAVELLRGRASSQLSSQRVAIRAGGAKLRLKKGGEVTVRLGKDRSAKIDVARGQAEVETENASIKMAEGQRGVIDATGQQTQPIQSLNIALVAPGPSERRFSASPKQEVTFQWKPRQGVGSYVFELSRDADFTNTIAAEKTKSLTVVRAGLEAGRYYWRVRGKLSSGEALSEDRKLTLVLDTAPLLIEPRDSQIIDLSRSDSVPFSWGEVSGVGRYRIEIAEDIGFDNPVAQATVNQPAYRLQKRLKEGRYCYRVRSQEAERPNAPWSDQTCFRVIHRPIYRAPKGYKPKREAVPTEEPQSQRSWFRSLFSSVAYADAPKSTAIIIRWEKIPGAPSYLIEIAEDKAFKNIVIKKRVTSNYYSWRTVVRRPHYWRVRVIDSDGREGKVSEPIRIDPEVSRPILSSPPSGAKFAFVEEAPQITLRWKGTEVLEKYIVEVSPNAAFTSGTKSHRVRGTNQFIIEAAEAGEFFWRVTGVDLLGKPTPPSEKRRFVIFVPAPKLTGPKKREVFVWDQESFNVGLSWSKRPVSSYEIQIADNARFRKPISKTSSRTSLFLTPPTMGTLYWRVRGISPGTDWSDTSRIEVKPKVPSPSHPLNESRENLEGDHKTVQLRWDAVPLVTTYEVRLIRQDAESQERVETRRVEGTTVSFDLKAGRYSWTVQALHESGAVSAKSTSQSFELFNKEPAKEVMVAQPVVEPKPPVDPQPPDDRTEQETPFAEVEPSSAVLYVAPRIGFLYNFGAIIAPSFGAEVSYLPPILDRHIRVALSVSYLTSASSHSSDQENASFESRLHEVPFELVVVYIIPTSVIDPYGGLGLLVDLRNRSLQVPSQPTLEQTDVEMGGVVLLGAKREIGFGDLFAQLSYALTTRKDSEIVESAPGGLGLSLGYRIGVW